MDSSRKNNTFMHFQVKVQTSDENIIMINFYDS